MSKERRRTEHRSLIGFWTKPRRSALQKQFRRPLSMASETVGGGANRACYASGPMLSAAHSAAPMRLLRSPRGICAAIARIVHRSR